MTAQRQRGGGGKGSGLSKAKEQGGPCKPNPEAQHLLWKCDLVLEWAAEKRSLKSSLTLFPSADQAEKTERGPSVQLLWCVPAASFADR